MYVASLMIGKATADYTDAYVTLSPLRLKGSASGTHAHMLLQS